MNSPRQGRQRGEPMDGFDKLVIGVFIFVILLMTAVVGTGLYLAIKNWG